MQNQNQLQLVKTERQKRRLAKKEAAHKELMDFVGLGVDALKHVSKDPYLTLVSAEAVLYGLHKAGVINADQFLRGTGFNVGFNILRASPTESSSIAGLGLMGLSALPGLSQLTGLPPEDPAATVPLIDPPQEGMEIVGNRSEQPPREGCTLIRRTFLGNVWECPKR